ncbi:MAG: response regulator [Magnetococcales bacterium]|nr:response regulator [Magnetococcales bacterium]
MRILIADDEPANLLILERYLSSCGTCTLAADGKQAVDLFSQALEEASPFNLVCLDIVMPVFDGVVALTKMRSLEAWHNVPPGQESTIFMVTSIDTAETMLRAFLQGGCTDYLNKPITREAMIKKLQQHGLIP